MPTENETFLYLTTTGHKSGQPHRIEIWFVVREGRYYIVAERREKTHWVQNIRANPQVQFSIGTRADNGVLQVALARVIAPDGVVGQAITRLMQDKYGWAQGTIVELTPD